MIRFNDLSHWNTDAQYMDALNSSPIIAHKASEGATFEDKDFARRVALAGDSKTIIAYHFLRADSNQKHPEREVKNYLNTLRKNCKGRRVVLALDFESPYCASNQGDLSFLVKCISMLLTLTGKEPYVYICDSQLTTAKKLGYDFSWIWCARWGNAPPVNTCGIWQYSNKPIDSNYFMVDDIELLKRHEVEI